MQLSVINNFLVQYDQLKGLFRRIFFDHAAIRALRRLHDKNIFRGEAADISNFQVMLCFIKNPITKYKNGTISAINPRLSVIIAMRVYEQIFHNSIRQSYQISLPFKTYETLYNLKLLDEAYFNELTEDRTQFDVLNRLNENNILTRDNIVMVRAASQDQLRALLNCSKTLEYRFQKTVNQVFATENPHRLIHIINLLQSSHTSKSNLEVYIDVVVENRVSLLFEFILDVKIHFKQKWIQYLFEPDNANLLTERAVRLIWNPLGLSEYPAQANSQAFLSQIDLCIDERDLAELKGLLAIPGRDVEVTQYIEKCRSRQELFQRLNGSVDIYKNEMEIYDFFHAVGNEWLLSDAALDAVFQPISMELAARRGRPPQHPSVHLTIENLKSIISLYHKEQSVELVSDYIKEYINSVPDYRYTGREAEAAGLYNCSITIYGHNRDMREVALYKPESP